MLLAGRSAAGFSALLGGLCVVCSIRLLIAFQILFHALLRIADGVRQFDLRKIVGIKTLNVAFVSAGNCLLRLHDFQIIGYPGGEAILGLCERLFRQVDGTASHLDLLGGSVQIEQSCANLIVDTTAEISELGARLLQLRVRFEYVAMNPIAGKNRDVNAPVYLPGAVGLRGVHTDVAKIGIDVDSRIMSCSCRLPRQFCCPNLCNACLIVRARRIGALQICVKRQRSQGLVRGLLGEDKLLAQRQADDPRQVQPRLGEIITGYDQLLLAGLKFYLGTQRVNGGSQSGFQLVGGLAVKSLSTLDLSFRSLHASPSSNGLEVRIANCENYHLPRVFVGEL